MKKKDLYGPFNDEFNNLVKTYQFLLSPDEENFYSRKVYNDKRLEAFFFLRVTLHKFRLKIWYQNYLHSKYILPGDSLTYEIALRMMEKIEEMINSRDLMDMYDNTHTIGYSNLNTPFMTDNPRTLFTNEAMAHSFNLVMSNMAYNEEFTQESCDDEPHGVYFDKLTNDKDLLHWQYEHIVNEIFTLDAKKLFTHIRQMLLSIQEQLKVFMGVGIRAHIPTVDSSFYLENFANISDRDINRYKKKSVENQDILFGSEASQEPSNHYKRLLDCLKLLVDIKKFGKGAALFRSGLIENGVDYKKVISSLYHHEYAQTYLGLLREYRTLSEIFRREYPEIDVYHNIAKELKLQREMGKEEHIFRSLFNINWSKRELLYKKIADCLEDYITPSDIAILYMVLVSTDVFEKYSIPMFVDLLKLKYPSRIEEDSKNIIYRINNFLRAKRVYQYYSGESGFNNFLVFLEQKYSHKTNLALKYKQKAQNYYRELKGFGRS